MSIIRYNSSNIPNNWTKMVNILAIKSNNNENIDRKKVLQSENS